MGVLEIPSSGPNQDAVVEDPVARMIVQGKLIKAIFRELMVYGMLFGRLRRVRRRSKTSRSAQLLPGIGPWKADPERLLPGNEARRRASG